MRPDHVIIGSGINALVAGAMLALKGRRVLLLERESIPGGCLRTGEITVPGFQHDVMAATWVLFMTSPAGAALGPHLARHGFDYCHTPHPTAVIRPNGEALVLTTDRATNIAAFNALATGDGDRHAADVGGIEADAPFLFALLGGSLWSWATAKLMWGQVRKRGLRGLAAWFGTGLVPARGWLETGYQSPLVQALYAPWVLHCGLTPESTYSGQMGKVIAFALEAAGAPVVKGGSGRAVAAFRALIEEKGGEIRCGADVDRILVTDGRVRGVALTSGEEILAPSVLASVAPGQLQGRLLRDVNLPQDQAAAKAFRHGRGNFQLHYALDRPPEWLSPGLDDVALIHLADGIDSVSKSANEAERGMLPATPTICVGQPHRLDPSRCPDGKAILWLQIPDAPRMVKGDAAGQIATDGTWSDTMREAFADRVEGILRRHIKDFDAIKLARRAYSPADLERMNINLVGGDPYGGLCSIDQFFIFRPYAHSTNGVGLVRGLIHIGASTHPGPGLGGGSGFLAAKRLGA
ncbi:NAD(P)/FAD-dependent oxidoreductase [Tabrizicola piscis]|uniref:Pyridine nucleotide-disulfide oxidoreductase domain-containing protein 2 n=1 Tax=Tabrizicola piscis TaxID=2494374 RepID=A0A3S8U746_9RHOB|nr:NAD(P)/FAD-dependent oxidoreductase [Tabrizicola piscis]AZL59397.1 NAD(P)/FAD-dependent oxidoreductase [Tabrizicola piscis]